MSHAASRDSERDAPPSSMRTFFGVVGAVLVVGCNSSSCPRPPWRTRSRRVRRRRIPQRSHRHDRAWTGSRSSSPADASARRNAARTPRRRGVFLQPATAASSRFAPSRRSAILDTRGAGIERSLAAVPKAAAEKYDRECDTALVHPHTSEIWRVDADLAYAPSGARSPNERRRSGAS